MFTRFSDLIDNSKRLLATRANNDWMRVVDAGRGIRETLGNAANDLVDMAAYGASRGSSRGIRSYADSPLGYKEWRALDLLEKNGQQDLARYAEYGLGRKAISFGEGGEINNAANMGQIGADEYAALKNAYKTAEQEMAAGQMVYDPKTLQMMQESNAAKAQVRGLDFTTPPMAEPMQRMAEQQSPNQLVPAMQQRELQERALESFLQKNIANDAGEVYDPETRAMWAALKQRRQQGYDPRFVNGNPNGSINYFPGY